MISEIQLFKDGIKPSLLVSQNIAYNNNINIKDYFCYTFDDDMLLLSHDPTPIIRNKEELGIALGYYPKSCELFMKRKNDKLVNEFLNFNGICFNTQHLFEESLEWCKKQYGDKMLIKYGKIKFYRITIKRESIEDKKWETKKCEYGKVITIYNIKNS